MHQLFVVWVWPTKSIISWDLECTQNFSYPILEFFGVPFFWPRVDGKVQCYVPARRWRQRRNGTRYEILPPQMCRNCIPPTRARCRNLWIVKNGARFIAHFCPDITRRKGVHLCQSVRFARLFSIAQPFWNILHYEEEGSYFFACCIFFIPPAVVHYTVYPPLWHIQQISPNMGSMQPHHKMI